MAKSESDMSPSILFRELLQLTHGKDHYVFV